MTTFGRYGRYITKVPHARARERSLGSFRPFRPKPSNVDVDDELGLSLDDVIVKPKAEEPPKPEATP